MGKAYNILLLDSDKSDIDLIETELNEQEIEFHVDIIREEGPLIDRLDNNPPDLVIGDNNLSKLSGLRALRIVRDRYPQLPFILIAGFIHPEKAVDLILEGASDFATKDNFKRLGKAVKRELQNYEQHSLKQQQGRNQVEKLQELVIGSMNGIVPEADSQTFEFHSNREKYRDTFNLSPQPMWVYDPETLKFLDVNRVAINHYGYRYKEFMHMTLKDIRPEDDIPALMESVSNIPDKNGSYYEGLFRHKTKDESIIYVNIKRNTIDYEGRKAVMVLADDVTEKLKAEHKLQLSEQRFKSLVRDGSDLIAILDNRGHYKYVAPTSESVLGISPEELVGNSALEYIHDKHKYRIQQVLANLPETKKTKIKPFLFKNGNGEWRWVESIITNLSDNPAVEGFIANSRDVTKQIEHEQNLKENLELFEYVTKATNDVIYDWDITKDILRWDGSFWDQFPYNIEKNYTISHWVQKIHPEDMRRVRGSLNYILENTEKSQWEQEYRFKKIDGSFATVFERGFIIRDNKGDATRMIGSLQDITERKQHEKDLQESLKEKETLLMEIHHRVKNNLAVVSGMMQLQAFDEEDERLKVKLLDSVVRIKTMASIHEYLYRSHSYSQIQLGQNIKILSSNVLEAFQKEDTIALNFDLEPVAVNINQAIPCSLIVNEILTNVCKHAFDHEQMGTLHIEILEENNNVEVRIRDNGHGMHDNFDNVSEKKSLGLQLIDTLATQLNATYGYTLLDEGTLFTLSFEKADVKGIGNAQMNQK